MTTTLKTLTFIAVLSLCEGAPAPASAQEAAPTPATPAVQPAPLPVRPSQPPPPAAPAAKRDVGVLFRMNLDFGGDKLASVKWSDGSTTDLRAGQLFTFSAGAIYHPVAPWALEATIGYKFDKVSSGDDTIEMTRFPLDVIASWVNGRHRLGVGPTVHFSPSLSCSVAGLCSKTLSYDTAVGAVAQYGYGIPAGLNGAFDLGLRVTVIHYAGSGLQSLDGTGVGFFLGGWL